MRTAKQRSQQQERRLAAEFRGNVRPASGALWNKKGDVVTDRLFIEAKTTAAKQYTLTLETLDKTARQAFGSMKIPVIIVSFESRRRDFVVLAKEDLQLLMEENGGKVG